MINSEEYIELWNSAEIDKSHLDELDHICGKIENNRAAYNYVQYHGNVPWFVVAAIHFRESSLNFQTHLHNGDPLTERTIHVPKGHPINGIPPFTWQESAVDAVKMFEYRPIKWDISGCLEFMERYNGLGYRNCGIHTPYLWDWTQHYKTGLFVRDGKFDPELRECRAGCVSILKSLQSADVQLPL